MAAAPAPAPGTSSGEAGRTKENQELWYACAGPLVALPPVGSLVVYFPQGHSEQVAASMRKDADAKIPSYPNLPSKLICILRSVTMLADPDTDEVYARMTLQPVSNVTHCDKETLLATELALKQTRPQTEFFCKTLTASDTSTHGGFSVPRRAAERIFPHLNFSMQPPAQELQARDLHDAIWTFRHIYRGQPKRHLLTTGWSLFVSGKRLLAGDSVLFIRDGRQQLLLGIRRANRQPVNLSSSVLSSDSMHIGILAAAAHAAANNSQFTVFYNPRASPSEFVIPFAKYQKAVYSNQLSLGMRFRMMFETEESATRRYMGTITGISDMDPVRWKNSQWRNIQVAWDEAAPSERRTRVSLWEVEPVIAPFFIYPSPLFTAKRPRQPGITDDDSSEMDNLFKRTMPWFAEEIGKKDLSTQNSLVPGLSLVQWMNMQQNSSLANTVMQPELLNPLAGKPVQTLAAADLSRQISFQPQFLQQNNIQFNTSLLPPQNQQTEQLANVIATPNQLGSAIVLQKVVQNCSSEQKQNPVTQQLQVSQPMISMAQPQLVHTQVQQPQVILQAQPQHPQVIVQAQLQQQQPLVQNHTTIQGGLQQIQLLQQQHPHLQQQQVQQSVQEQQQIKIQPFHQVPNDADMVTQLSDQMKIQLLKALQPQQPLVMEQQKMILDLQQQAVNSHSTAQQCSQVATQVVGLHSSSTIQYPTQQKTQPPKPIHEFPGNAVSIVKSEIVTSMGARSLHVPGGVQSMKTDDVPSSSTSPSTNNNPVILRSTPSSSKNQCLPTAAKAPQSSVVLGSTLEQGMKPFESTQHTMVIPKMTEERPATGQDYMNSTQMDYLDTSSSATSVCLSQADGSLQQNFPPSSFNQHQPLRETVPDSEFEVTDAGNNFLFGANIDGHMEPLNEDSLLGTTFETEKYMDQMPGNGISNYISSKDSQQELSSSMISHSFGVADIAFNSIDSSINDIPFLNRNSRAPGPAHQRIRTYTKVHKRGAVGRSIDINRYSGYDELKHDIARMFGIEGQLSDQNRVGWKLVYEDHEKDVLLVGDDPWESFVNCVRCIRILSPQEERQMRLASDYGDSFLGNQACSSSDGGHPWRVTGD
ncbi:LOW QUALITY PROTEIN: auxin response factor 21-like [Miscanthus floridulus]|uniref:LOW QUALITY PROTEIN: auxin response factor 21-like n=1 Tax=Miscanthus floridulus TaxID=154761 RepID=UPI00345A1811